MIALLFFNHVVVEKRKFSKVVQCLEKTNAEYYKGEACGIRQVEVSQKIWIPNWFYILMTLFMYIEQHICVHIAIKENFSQEKSISPNSLLTVNVILMLLTSNYLTDRVLKLYL